MTQENLVCTSCEKVTQSAMNFSENGKIVFVVCFECLSLGIRWIVRQARDDEQKRAE